MSNIHDLPIVFSAGSSTEYLLRTGVDISIAITNDRVGARGSWKVAFAVVSQAHATGYKVWADRLDTGDDAFVEADELLKALISQGWDKLTGQDVG